MTATGAVHVHLRPAPAVLLASALALVGWCSGVAAQSVSSAFPQGGGIFPQGMAVAPTPLLEPLTPVTGPGVIPQPTPNDPGLVTGVTLGELYTNNLKLAGPGQPRRHSWITQIQPFIRTAGSAPRFSGLADLSLTGYLYPGHGHDNQLTGTLNTQGSLTVLPQHFFIDGTAIYGRQVFNNAQPAGSGTFFLDDNSVNVGRATLSPYWVQDLGRAGTAILRYTRGRIFYNDNGIPGDSGTSLSGIPDVTSNAVQFSLSSPQDQLWGWSLGYSRQVLDPDFGPHSQFSVATVGISREVSQHIRLLADGGKQDKYLPNGTVDTLGAWFWDVGVQWTSARDRIKLLGGQRFYGSNFEFSWNHTAALLTTTLSYLQQPTNLSQQLLGQNPGQIVLTPANTREFPSLAERQIYLMKRAAATVGYQLPHSKLNLTLYDEWRDYFLSHYGDEKVTNANLDWAVNLGPFTTVTPTIGWQRYQFRNHQVNYTEYVQLDLVHQINRNNFARLRARYDTRHVTAVAAGEHGYHANVILLQWTHLF